MAEHSTDAVLGHLIRLDATRLVYLGHDPEHIGLWFVGFRNSAGEDTKLTLSTEAMNAFIQLHQFDLMGERVPYPHKTVWRVTEGSEDEYP